MATSEVGTGTAEPPPGGREPPLLPEGKGERWSVSSVHTTTTSAMCSWYYMRYLLLVPVYCCCTCDWDLTYWYLLLAMFVGRILLVLLSWAGRVVLVVERNCEPAHGSGWSAPCAAPETRKKEHTEAPQLKKVAQTQADFELISPFI